MRKAYYKNFAKSNITPQVNKDTWLFDSVASKSNYMRLFDYSLMYRNLQPFRNNYNRCVAYEFGRQWSDTIVDPDNPSQTITEEHYILRQGRVPLKNNVIRKTIKSVVGLYRSNKSEPVAIARDRDEQKYGEMMSIALQYAHQVNKLEMLDARTLEEFLNSGAACQMVRFKWNRERSLFDVSVEKESLNRIFLNSDVSDPRGNDINTFGVLRDMNLADVIESFAKKPEDAKKIREIYSGIVERLEYSFDAFDKNRFIHTDFFMPSDRNKCRVIEVWTIESKERLRVHDVLKGEIYIAELNMRPQIEKENQERIKEFLSNGVAEDDVPVMNIEWFVDRYWFCQYLTPTGDVLFESETPFAHGSHPFAFLGYPLVNGEIHSFVEDFIDQQRYINRYITMMDFIRGTSAKGVLLFPEEALGDLTKAEVMEEWVKPNGVIFAKMKKDINIPQSISSQAIQTTDVEMVRMMLSLVDDISGVHGALQGQTSSAGTPASLYAQQSQNATINLVDILDTFASFKKDRDFKMMKLIQQYYNEPRYINIAGKDYSEEAKFYNPEKIKNTEFDISISQSPSTPAFRMLMDDMLMQLIKEGLIDIETYLENASLPFADKILSTIRRKKQEVEQGQIQGQPMGAEVQQLMQGQGNEQAQQMLMNEGLLK